MRTEKERERLEDITAFMCCAPEAPVQSLGGERCSSAHCRDETGTVSFWAPVNCVPFSKWAFSNSGAKENQELTTYPLGKCLCMSLSES